MNFLRKYYEYFTLLFVSFVYLFTIAPSVIQIDSGELAAVQATLGIAHPTGYPLFTMLGYLFSIIPLPFTTIYQLNLLALIWCVIGLLFFIKTIKLILDNLNQFVVQKKIKQEKKGTKKGKQNEATELKIIIEEDIKIFISAIAGLILAFSFTFWHQSVSVEVYSLHISLISLIIYFLVKAFLSDKSSMLYWFVLALVLALGFSNHMTTLLILPGIAYLFFTKFGINKVAFQKMFKMISLFIPVLILVYLYLPIRAAQNPILNWGNPIDVERMLRHISGFQYQVWLFTSMEAAKEQLQYFFSTLSIQFSVSLILVFIGIVYSFVFLRKLFFFAIISLVFTVAYSINYSISDIDSYFLLAYISMAIFSAFGLLKLFLFLRDKKLKLILPIILSGVIIALQLAFTFGKVTQHENYVFEDYTKAALNSTSKNAIIFSYQWDYLISASYYFQFVENFRKDVAVIDKELLRRSWYYNQIEKNYPDVIDEIKPTIFQFLESVKLFERSENYNANTLQFLYQKIMTDLVATNFDEREFYIAPELVDFDIPNREFILPEGYSIVPDIFFFKVVKGNEYVPVSDPNFTIRFPKNRNVYIDNLEKIIGKMLLKRALYETQFDKRDRAKLFLKKVRSEFPNVEIPAGITEAIEK